MRGPPKTRLRWEGPPVPVDTVLRTDTPSAGALFICVNRVGRADCKRGVTQTQNTLKRQKTGRLLPSEEITEVPFTFSLEHTDPLHAHHSLCVRVAGESHTTGLR